MKMNSSKMFLQFAAVFALLCGCAKQPNWTAHDLPKFVDPDGDCKCETRDGVVELSVPGTVHDMAAELHRANGPRALCEAEGDFSIRVKIECSPSPKTQTVPERRPYHGAGLVIIQDDNNFIRFDRAAAFVEEDDTVIKYAGFELREKGKLKNGFSPDEPSMSDCYMEGDADMTYLRLDRRGPTVTAYLSSDGVRWSRLGEKTVQFPAAVSVGVMVTNSALEPFSAKFSQFAFAVQNEQR